VLATLFGRLSFIGILPYYVFACRPTEGNKAYAVPVEEAYALYEAARVNQSGLAKTARFVMSHRLGKLEIAGMTDRRRISGNSYFPAGAIPVFGAATGWC
jgi:L-lysine 2,3-aminomutase